MNDFVVGLVEEHVGLDGSRFSESTLERWRTVVILEFWSPCLPQFSHELSHCRCWAFWSHDTLQGRLVLQRCVYQDALIYHESSQHWDSCCLQMNMLEHWSLLAWYQVALIYHESSQHWDSCCLQMNMLEHWSRLAWYQVALIYHESSQHWDSSCLQMNKLEHWSRLAWYQVALIYHNLDLELVGLVGRILLVEQLLLLAVEQLLLLAVEQLSLQVVEQLSSPILESNRDAVRSLVVVEVTCMLFHVGLLQFSVWQLLEYNKLEVFLEGWLQSIESDRMSILSEL